MVLHACNLSAQNSEPEAENRGLKTSLGYTESSKLIYVI